MRKKTADRKCKNIGADCSTVPSELISAYSIDSHTTNA